MGRVSKWFQRRVLDALQRDTPPVVRIVVGSLIAVFVLGYCAALYKGHVVLPGQVSHRSFSDNIAGRSFFAELGNDILPIDVVYTWVNGSDPVLVSGLRRLLRSYSAQCSPPHYCAQARYVAAPLRSSINMSYLSSIVQATPNLAGAEPVSATLDGSHKQFVVARVMSRPVVERGDASEGSITNTKPSPQHSDQGGNTASSDVEAVLRDLQRRLTDAAVDVVGGQALWSTESNHGWSVAKKTAAFVISSTKQDLEVLYSRLTRHIPEFAVSCDRQLVPDGFFVECIDKLLIEDLREAVILNNTPQTDDLNNDVRVQSSLLNNMPQLATKRPRAARDKAGVLGSASPGKRVMQGKPPAKLPSDSIQNKNLLLEMESLSDHEKNALISKEIPPSKHVNDSQMLVQDIAGDFRHEPSLSPEQQQKADEQNMIPEIFEIERNTGIGGSGRITLSRVQGEFEKAVIGKYYNDTHPNHGRDFSGNNTSLTDQYHNYKPNKKHKTLQHKDAASKNTATFRRKRSGQPIANHQMFNIQSNYSSNMNRRKRKISRDNLSSNSTTRKLMVLGGRFQHKRPNMPLDGEHMKKAALKQRQNRDRAVNFRSGGDIVGFPEPSETYHTKKPFIEENNPTLDKPRLDELSTKASEKKPVFGNQESSHQNSTRGRRPSRKSPVVRTPPTDDAAAANKQSKGARDASFTGPVQFLPAYLLLQILENDKLLDGVTVNRFQDSEELRYSLRSLEQYAGWVRHIYLVTNGQIPYWLNLDHPRLSIVTHQEIFPNSSHLPTYSSPAIESHLHRIPGLSRHFLYLNDDVLLGSAIWPQDFYTQDQGQKVYLSWQLPNCASRCANSWLGDGFCDAPCNVSLCNFDGGDCVGETSEGVDNLMDGSLDESLYDDRSALQCSDGCTNAWLADGYCDMMCDVAPCGHDCGDCGISSLHTLPALHLPAPNTSLQAALNSGTVAWWIDLSPVFCTNCTVEGDYFIRKRMSSHEHRAPYAVPEDTRGVLSLTANRQLRLVVAVVQQNFTGNLELQLKVRNQDTGGLQWFNYNITYKSFHSVESVVSHTTEAAKIHYYHFKFDFPRPVEVLARATDHVPSNGTYCHVDAKASGFGLETVQEIQRLTTMFLLEELTLTGFMKKKYLLVQNYLKQHPDINEKSLVYLNPGWITNLKINATDSAITTARAGVVDSATGTLTVKDTSVGARKLLWIRNSNDELAILEEGHNIESNLKYKRISNSRTHVLNNHPTRNPKNLISIGGAYVDPDSSSAGTKYLNHIPDDENSWPAYNDKSSAIERIPGAVANIPPVGEDNIVSWAPGRRKLLDVFSDSLLFVNRLYNDELGLRLRKVPAHTPHFINVSVMEEMQQRFSTEFTETSSHRVRQPHDMQYAFSYYYYLLGMERERTLREIFDSVDTDHSGTLSDREIRTLMSRIGPIPVEYQRIQELHRILRNCSDKYTVPVLPTPPYERYADSTLPTVTLALLEHCKEVHPLLQPLRPVPRYRATELTDSVVHFKMITSNLSRVITVLDEVRKEPRKFICLNNNLDPEGSDNAMIMALLQDTYEALYPVPSSFELPLNYRNRFLYMRDLYEWKLWRDLVRFVVYFCFGVLVFITLTSFCGSKIEGCRRRWCRRVRSFPVTSNESFV